MNRVLREIDLQNRLTEIDAEIDQLRLTLEDRESEKAKIAVVIEAMAAYGAPSGATNGITEHSAPAPASAKPSNGEIVRPEGIPTTRQMILTVVREANLNGKGPTQNEVVEGIRR